MAAMPTDEGYRVRPLTREDYDVLIANGSYDDVRIELLDGELVEMAPQGPEHSDFLSRLGRTLQRTLDSSAPDTYLVRPQVPLATGQVSVPEPDLAVVDDKSSVTTSHPVTAHLAVEIAMTSHRIDLVRKPAMYAAAEVPLYWVIDLVARQVVVHTQPYAANAAMPAGYGSITRVPLGSPLEVLGVTITIGGTLAV